MGRFINADGFASTGQGLLGNNMFAYCGNNPVNRMDSSGQSWVLAALIVVTCVVFLTGCEKTPQNNCYSYALKLENDPRTGKPFTKKPSPGVFSGNELTAQDLKADEDVVKKTIVEKVSADAQTLGLTFTEVYSADYVTKPGNWVVALAYAKGLDYHWWRRDEDGTWSHKQGLWDPVSWDAAGNVITDPGKCDRGNYDQFLGYFEVGPN